MKKAHSPKKGSRRAAKPWLWAVLLALGMQVPIEVGKALVVDVTKEKAREAISAIHLGFPVDWDRMTPDQVVKRLTAPTWDELVAQVRVERMEAERKSFEKELPRRWLPSFGL